MTYLLLIATAVLLFFTLATPHEVVQETHGRQTARADLQQTAQADLRQAGVRQAAQTDLRQTVAAIVANIQRADYEGDRAALQRLHDELTPFVATSTFKPTPTPTPTLASRVLYWRGFALWRRAFNAFNDAPDPKTIDNDLTLAAADFHDAVTSDPTFVDAKIAEASCVVNSGVLNRGTDHGRELWERAAQLMKEATSAAPDNPRLLWVQGANEWWTPSDHGGSQSLALATYQRGLELARQQKGRVTDPLEPTWGEPELLMNLAYANLHRATPDLAAAERYAREALTLVPYWHYVRDVLMVQIRDAKGASR
jgi:hypothetical protein